MSNYEIRRKIPPTDPPGKWKPIRRGISFDVAGVHHRKADATAFVIGADKCEQQKRPWGVSCKREPLNPHDDNAIAVTGWWTKKGLFKSRQEERSIGYWPREISAAVAAAIPHDVHVGARVTKLYLSDDGFIDIEIVGLIDASWSGRLE